MGFKRLNLSLKILIKTGSFMRVSTVVSTFGGTELEKQTFYNILA